MSKGNKGNLKKLNYSINQIMKKMPKRAFKTTIDTQIILKSIAKDLHSLGYTLDNIKRLKTRHIDALVNKWIDDGASVGTIKNKLSKLRLTATLIEKTNIIKVTNKEYGIGKRTQIPSHNKAINDIDLSKIKDPYLRLSIEAQQLFGLRREESLKIVLSKADQGDFLALDSAWTKGGVPRRIRITSQAQRDFLERAKAFVGHGKSLIPSGKTNKQQVNRYIDQTRQVGFRNLHGLRHAYAQRRYRELCEQIAGKPYECPLRGGKLRKYMTEEERLLDEKVRMILSRELGHSRISVVRIYVG